MLMSLERRYGAMQKRCETWREEDHELASSCGRSTNPHRAG